MTKKMKERLKMELWRRSLELRNPARHSILTGIIEHRTILTELLGTIIKLIRR